MTEFQVETAAGNATFGATQKNCQCGVAAVPMSPQTYLLFFHQWSPALTPEAKAIVDQASAKAKATQPSTITVAGYTDTVGSAEDNKRLAEGRVKTVQDAMITDGVDPKLFLAIPLGPADDTAGMTGDRRIEIRLTYGN
jgi:outer membrane protein OmpA-like peptidoglycan-associated protein